MWLYLILGNALAARLLVLRTTRNMTGVLMAKWNGAIGDMTFGLEALASVFNL